MSGTVFLEKCPCVLTHRRRDGEKINEIRKLYVLAWIRARYLTERRLIQLDILHTHVIGIAH
jgi:hypothetical protein